MKPNRKTLMAWPLKYKFAAWSSLLILILFIGYSLIQYQLVYRHMLEGEKDGLRKTAGEIAGFFAERDLPPGQGEWSDKYFQPFVRHNQMMRLLDDKGRQILVTSSDLPVQEIPAQSAGQEVFNQLQKNQDHILLLRSPIRTASFHGTVELATNLETLDSLNEQLFTLIIVCCAAGIVISAMGGLFLARKLLGPVQRLGETINKVKQQGLHERVNYTDNGDELSRLAVLFNGMMDELERSFLGQRRLIEDASHEFRTPIAIIEGHLTMLRRWGKADPKILEESLDAAIQETERLKSLAGQMLELTRMEADIGKDSVQITRLGDLIPSLIRNYELLHAGHPFRTEFDPDFAIAVNPHHLAQMLIIVADNAVRYSDQGESVTIRAFPAGERMVIEVEDRGWGIPEEDLPYVFDRFYRVDKARNRKQGGSGLGLPIAKRLAEVYGGTIGIRSVAGEGTVVRLDFPRAASV